MRRASRADATSTRIADSTLPEGFVVADIDAIHEAPTEESMSTVFWGKPVLLGGY